MKNQTKEQDAEAPAKPSPMPWRQASTTPGDEYAANILSGDGTRQTLVARCHIRPDGKFDYPEAEANAAFIVRACNAYDTDQRKIEALVKALSAFVDAEFDFGPGGKVAKIAVHRDDVEDARAALALAKGGTA